MRRLISSLAALTASATCLADVTVYGVVDVFAQRLSAQGSVWRLQSGGLSGSRLGFKATEDLGDGLRANAVLEMGINADDGSLGQGGLAFGRQAYVGFSSQLGEVSAGRQYGSIFRLGTEFSAFSIGPYGPSSQVFGGFGGYEPIRGAGSGQAPRLGATGNGAPQRISNSLKYTSPAWHGLQLSGVLGLGERGSGVARDSVQDISVRYTAGDLDVLLLHVKDEVAGAKNTTHALGGTYGWRPFKFFAAALKVHTAAGSNTGAWVGAEYSTKPHTFRAQLLRSRPADGGETKAFGIGYQLDFSKRTAVYASLTRFNNEPTTQAGLGRFNAAVPGGLTSPDKNDINELVFGIKHSF